MGQTVQLKNLVLGAGIPKICVPLVGETRFAVEQEAAAAVQAGADIVEWRADCFCEGAENNSVLEMLMALPEMLHGVPLLFTVRSKAEGGNCPLAPEEIENILLQAVSSGAIDAIDIEFCLGIEICNRVVEKAKEKNVVTIVSSHDFKNTPTTNEMLERLQAMAAVGQLPKLAVMPHTPQDVLALLEATSRFCASGQPAITMAMGWLGGISRVAGEFFGSAVTFGAVQNTSAPGQLPIKELQQTLHLLHCPGQ